MATKRTYKANYSLTAQLDALLAELARAVNPIEVDADGEPEKRVAVSDVEFHLRWRAGDLTTPADDTIDCVMEVIEVDVP